MWHFFHSWARVSFEVAKSEPAVRRHGKMQKVWYEIIDICVDCGKHRVKKVLPMEEYLPL
jgi:hypothetical protein